MQFPPQSVTPFGDCTGEVSHAFNFTYFLSQVAKARLMFFCCILRWHLQQLGCRFCSPTTPSNINGIKWEDKDVNSHGCIFSLQEDNTHELHSYLFWVLNTFFPPLRCRGLHGHLHWKGMLWLIEGDTVSKRGLQLKFQALSFSYFHTATFVEIFQY